MPCSALFQGYIRTTMSLGSTSATTTSLVLRNHHCNLKKHSSLGFIMRYSNSVQTQSFRGVYYVPSHVGYAGFTCFASSRTVEVDWRQRQQRQRQRQRSVELPFWHQQSLNYGKYAYQDASSGDETDMELGSSRHQMVSLVHSFICEFLND